MGMGAAVYPEIDDMSIIDLGGTAESWLRAPVRPGLVHVINLEPPPESAPGWLRVDQADACSLPARIIDGSYDLAFSNSVLEHVGGHVQRMRFADAVHKLAPGTGCRPLPVFPRLSRTGFSRDSSFSR